MKQLFIYLGTLALMAGLSSCSEDVEPKPATYTQLLTGETSKNWRLTTVQILEGGTVDASIPASAFGCVGDDIYTFFANAEKTFQVKEGNSKCEADDPDLVAENNWSMVNANATLTFIVPLLADGPLPFIVKELTANELTVEIYLGDPDDTSYRLVFTPSGG